MRSKDFVDNATPSGNSVAVLVLLKLAEFTGNEDYQRRAMTMLRLLANQMRRYPSAFGYALCGLDFYLSTPKEIALVGNPDDDSMKALLKALWRTYLPNRVISSCTSNWEKAAQLIPFLRERQPKDGTSTAYFCEGYTCQIPSKTGEELLKQLSTRE